MEQPRNFEIFLRRRIPVVSSLLMGLMLAFFIFAFILLIVMTPSSNSSDEMRLAYYILAIPDSIKKISSIGLLGLIVTIPIYYRARLNRAATLTVNTNAITIKAENIDLFFNTNQIEKIFVNDLHDLRRQLKYKLQIVIQQRSGKQTAFRLKNYTEGDDFISTVSVLKNVTFSFYDDNMPTDHEDE